MEKVVFLFGRKPGVGTEEFRRHYLDVHAPLALRSMQGLHRYVVNLPDPDPESDADAPFDAVTELTVDSAAGLFDPARAFTSGAAADEVLADHASFLGTMHAYRVTERVVKDYDRTWPDGARSPGVKYVSLMRRAPGSSPQEFDAYWRDRHTPVALEHHGGMWKYVQNVVREPMTADAPPFDGMVEMHFPTVEEFRERFFTPPESMDLVLEDAYRFMDRSTLGYPVGEYVQLG
ncbi:MAG: EthD domain-containing protein [Acidimicrobiia bacterium]